MIVVILGMHRSGTSLASGLLKNMGLYFGEPDEFIRPNIENPKGFWERKDVRVLNDYLLHSIDCDWSEISGIAQAEFNKEVIDSFREKASSILSSMAGASAGMPLGLKEPRLCLLMPQWLEVMDDEVFYVLVHRDPEEIGISLHNRNQISPEVSNYLTEQYLGRAMNIAANGPHYIASFSELIENPMGFVDSVADALRNFGCQLSINKSAIDKFVTPGFYRSKSTGDGYHPGKDLQRWSSCLKQGILPSDISISTTVPKIVLEYQFSHRFKEFKEARKQEENFAKRVQTLEARLLAIRDLEEKYQNNRLDLQQEAYDQLENRLNDELARSSVLESKLSDKITSNELLEKALNRLEKQAIENQHRQTIALGKQKQLQKHVYELENKVLCANNENFSRQEKIQKLNQSLLQYQQLLQNSNKKALSLLSITDSLVERMKSLGDSMSWKLINPLLSFMLNPKSLGSGSTVLKDFKVILRQFDTWVGASGRECLMDNEANTLNINQQIMSSGAEVLANTRIRAETEIGRPNRLVHYFQGSRKSNPRIGLAVTETSESSGAGDYYTASELASKLENTLDWECLLLGQKDSTRDWYDLADLDCVIVLLESYDLRKIPDQFSDVLKIAWIRNWTDQWVSKPWFSEYDVILCTSEIIKSYIEERTGQLAYVFKIATNPERFNPSIKSDPELKSDYCFTGNYWGVKRKIEQLRPDEHTYDFGLFGTGWDQHDQFEGSRRGGVTYQRIPDVYASTQLLIDDANHAVLPWGSVNSRVFDALASGTLVITNGKLGAMEVFDDLLPTYSTKEELEQLITFYLDHPQERSELAHKLREKVLNQHTYEIRARELEAIIKSEIQTKARIAIKLPVPTVSEAQHWGDFHFGNALAKSLRKLGYAVRLDCLNDWYTTRAIPDDVVLTIRGLSRYQANPQHVNLLWIISHPDEVELEECEAYDHVYVASKPYAATLAKKLSTNVSTLLQCTDSTRFRIQERIQRSSSILFVGNSRNQYRTIVKHAVESGLKPTIIGRDWHQFVDGALIECDYFDNATLSEVYAGSGVVLCDHWEDMRQKGFISNRIFDVVAAGALPLSDEVVGLSDVFGDLVHTFDGTKEDLRKQIESLLSQEPSFMRERIEKIHEVIKKNNFDVRAETLDEEISRILPLRETSLLFS